MREAITKLTTACLLGAASSCAVDSLPPLGEVVLHVDTDLPAPSVAGRLRIDLYDQAGRWFETRDLARPNADDWPVSFSVYVQQDVTRRVWVRLRVYPEGKVRDYQGERFQDWPEVLLGPEEGDGEPRLLRDGLDLTPESEPEPLLTVDRLVLIEIPRETRKHAVVTLHGACAGTMPRLSDTAGPSPVGGQATSCVDRPQDRARVVDQTLAADAPAGRSQQGTWPGAPCATGADDERVCVSGGALVFGNRSLVFTGHGDAAPERVVAVDSFRMDARELTVGRFRAALEAGFVPPAMPVANDGPLSTEGDGACTFSTVPTGREEHAINCLSWETARAYCRFQGGDLPSEVQWEYAATREGRDRKTSFPWGDADPACDEVVFGRLELAGLPGYCAERGDGPVPVGTDDWRDATPSGIRGLGGGMSEWVRDGAASYDDPCWAEAVLNPSCPPEGRERLSVRGGSWASPLPVIVSTIRLSRGQGEASNIIGVRCAYEAAP